jgi:hypothetical protein
MEVPEPAAPVGQRLAVTADVDPALLSAMTRLGRGCAGDGAPAQLLAARVLAARGESVVVRVGPVVVKAHHEGSDPAELAARVAVAADPRSAGILLPPLLPQPQRHAGRWLSVWPFGRTVDPEPDAAPWSAAARLLARLHTAIVEGVPPLPAAGGPLRVARSVAALAGDDDPDAVAVRAAWQTLPPWARGERPQPGPLRLAHGDWHFGQLVTGPDGGWALCDVDDLGLGDPLWDLGRPAAYRAIGVVTAEEFVGFLDEYRAAGGPLDAGPDPWPALDVPARAYAVHTAARSLLTARRAGVAPDDVTRELLAACRRMVAVAPH